MKSRHFPDEKKKDIHEKDVEYLKRSRLTADYCADKCNWNMVECIDNYEMRSPEEIGNDVFKIVSDLLDN